MIFYLYVTVLYKCIPYSKIAQAYYLNYAIQNNADTAIIAKISSDFIK